MHTRCLYEWSQSEEDRDQDGEACPSLPSIPMYHAWDWCDSPCKSTVHLTVHRTGGTIKSGQTALIVKLDMSVLLKYLADKVLQPLPNTNTTSVNVNKPLSSSNDDASPLSQLEMLSLVHSNLRLVPENERSIQLHEHISYERSSCEKYNFLLQGTLLASFIGLPTIPLLISL